MPPQTRSATTKMATSSQNSIAVVTTGSGETASDGNNSAVTQNLTPVVPSPTDSALPMGLSSWPPGSKVTPYLECVPKFSGEGENVSSFFYRFEEVASYAGWQDPDKIFVLGVCLKDRALSYFRENLRAQGLRDYDPIKAALLARFKVVEMAHEPTRRLVQALQRPHETVREFAARIEALSFKTTPHALRGKPEGEVARLELLAGVFLEGLRPDIRRLVIPQNPKTFQAAVQLAAMEEEFFPKPNAVEGAEVRVAQASVPTSPPVPDSVLKLIQAQQQSIAQLTDMMGELQTKVQGLSQPKTLVDSKKGRSGNSQNRPARQGSARVRCWSCGKEGHVRNECRTYLQMSGHSNLNPNANPYPPYGSYPNGSRYPPYPGN